MLTRNFLHWILLGYSSFLEAKRSRHTAHQSMEPASEDTNQSIFVVFLREAGVTLRPGGTSNEIGKHTPLHNTQASRLNPFSNCFSFNFFPPPAVDQAVFQKRIQQQLLKSPRYPRVSIYRESQERERVRESRFIDIYNFSDYTGIHHWIGVSYWGPWAVQELPLSLCSTVIWCRFGVTS